MSQERADEQFAFAVAANILDVEVEPFDINDRQRAVDAILHFPDGRDAAMEVTSVGPEDEAAILNFLGRTGYRRTGFGITGRWLVNIPRNFHPSDVRKIEEALRHCESREVTVLAELFGEDKIIDELVDKGVRATRLANISGQGLDRPPGADLILSSFGGFPGEGFTNLPSELAALLSTVKLERKLAKLLASNLPELHLFLIVRPSGFSYPVYDALAFGRDLPRDPPILPRSLNQAWLVTGIGAGGVVRAISGQGWCRDHPYENWTSPQA
jgi:hypothetical protein